VEKRDYVRECVALPQVHMCTRTHTTPHHTLESLMRRHGHTHISTLFYLSPSLTHTRNYMRTPTRIIIICLSLFLKHTHTIVHHTLESLMRRHGHTHISSSFYLLSLSHTHNRASYSRKYDARRRTHTHVIIILSFSLSHTHTQPRIILSKI